RGFSRHWRRNSRPPGRVRHSQEQSSNVAITTHSYGGQMKVSKFAMAGILGSVALASVALPAQAQQANMTVFVTSPGSGKGGDLGGLEGADAHCASLAKAAGAKATSWHAYLSTALPGGDQGVDARSRIGKGPWQNAKGVVVAKNVDDLHSGHNNINKQTA